MSLLETLQADGYNFFIGVPDSTLKEFVNEIIDKKPHIYIPAAREDVAMSLAVGAFMAGKKPVVFLQNSGLGHLVNIITSLLKPYGIEIHLVISVRYKPFQHTLMGSITCGLLKLLKYDHNVTLMKQKI
jgi:phosphonopyruvate decarboxylase